jgi:hypothetical protein
LLDPLILRLPLDVHLLGEEACHGTLPISFPVTTR